MTKHLKIAFDARFYNEAGPGRYVKNILKGLEKLDTSNTYYVLLRKHNFDDYMPASGNFIKVLADYPWYSFKEQTLFLLKLLLLRCDILYVPHFNIPILYPKKIITAIPDVIMHSFSTEEGTTLPKNYFKIKKLVYKIVTYIAIFRSTKVIVPSMTTLEDIAKYFNLTSKDKLIYAPEGVDEDINITNVLTDEHTFFANYGIKAPYMLTVGSMYEHKNIVRLVHAFDNYCKSSGKLNLVIAGKSDKFSQRIVELITSLKLENRIFLPGQIKRLDDREVNTLRKGCEFYIFASLKEGFSLTPMECMVFNKACSVSDIPCHKEIYGDSVLYFNPSEINDISAKLWLIASDEKLRENLIQKGTSLLQNYSWEITAQKTLAVLTKTFE